MRELTLRKFFSLSLAFIMVVSLGITLLPVVPVQAACSSEVWVAPPPTGSDLNPGTEASPFATIQKGVNEVCPGGTVNVAAGTYTQGAGINKPLTLRGAGRDVTTVNISYAFGFYVTADSVKISGFTVTAHYSNGIVLDGVSNCGIYSNTFTGCYYGISLWTAYNNTVGNNNANDNRYDGIYLWRSTGNTITNNDASDNWRDGIVLWDSDGNDISNNIVSGNLGWSCPYVYSWNGQDYQLDAHMLGNAPRPNAEKSDYDSLEYLVPSDGKHLLKLTEEQDETSWIDELKLIVVDHVIGSKVVMDMQGNIHTLCSPSIPLDAVDEEGIDCLAAVTAQDGNYWSSDIESKDFSNLGNPDDLRDGVILTFDKPAGATSATVVATYRKTGLGAFIHVHWARIFPQPPVPPKVRQLGIMLNSLQLQVKNGAIWSQRIPFMDTSGSTLGRSDIAFTGDISGIPGNTLTIKVESITGLVDIDSVTVYYADCDEPATSVELAAASAIDGNGTDVTGLLETDDSDYLVLEKGDYADLNFYYTEPVSPGYERSYFVKANGYYVFPELTPLPAGEANNLMGQFKDDYDKAYRFYLEKYYPSPADQCGIDLYYSSSNLISGNEIFDNAYEGIYLGWSDSNRIIGNHIYENDCGIWIECADNNEILCNNIRDNSEWSGIMVDYYADYMDCYSSGNSIRNNNIVGNMDYGLFNGSDMETVDATDNWWGATDGPSHSPGSGDKVSDFVEYDPWLRTEVQCQECAENGGVLSEEDQLIIQKGGQNSSPGVSPQNRQVPPSFSTQYMNIYPLQAQVNQPVTITTNVVNSGQETGNYDVVLKVNGKPEQTKMVSVGPGATYPVNFTVAMSRPGTYTVNIENQQGSFMVLDDGKAAGTSVNTGWIAILVLGALAIVIAVFLIRALRRSN
jgi:parallel beta-helix repeat protein